MIISQKMVRIAFAGQCGEVELEEKNGSIKIPRIRIKINVEIEK